MVWIFSDAILPKNIWCYLINKTFKQLNAERAARRAKLQEGIDYEVDNIDDYIKRVKSSQAGGPAHNEPGFKR
jgi:hypothetical protein